MLLWFLWHLVIKQQKVSYLETKQTNIQKTIKRLDGWIILLWRSHWSWNLSIQCPLPVYSANCFYKGNFPLWPHRECRFKPPSPNYANTTGYLATHLQKCRCIDWSSLSGDKADASCMKLLVVSVCTLRRIFPEAGLFCFVFWPCQIAITLINIHDFNGSDAWSNFSRSLKGVVGIEVSITNIPDTNKDSYEEKNNLRI